MTKVNEGFMPNRPNLDSIVNAARDMAGFCCFDTADGHTLVTWGEREPHTTIEGWERFVRANTQGVPMVNSTYSGGVVGWIGYEAGRSVETMPPPSGNRPTHDICLWRTDGAIVHHTHSGAISVHGSPAFKAQAAKILSAATVPPPTVSAAPKARAYVPVSHTQQSRRYTLGVQRILDHVQAGDVYQVNLSWEQAAIPITDALSTWLRLRTDNPAVRGCYLRQGPVEIISNSPELFLSIAPRERLVVSKPIKGTAAIDGGEPARLGLEESPKEKAELTMIVDLVRNDLGRVAEPGSVHASARRLRQCGDLWHAEQEVSATLAIGQDAVSAFGASFPPGSVTGAPKVRAMAVIGELEPGPRGIYTGAIGWFADGGGAHFNVAIRTATVVDGLARFHVGAGIVAESQPSLEWAETLAKSKALLQCLNA